MNENTAARKKALKLLELRDRTESELAGKLKEKGFDEDAVNDALQYVISFGYINDERYVENYVFYYKDKKSKRQIAFDLQKKGLDKAMVTDQLEKLDYDETPLIRSLALKKIQRIDMTKEGAWQKVRAFLFSKGFDYNDINSVCSDLKSGIMSQQDL